MNIVTVSFDTIMGQPTEMSQWTNTQIPREPNDKAELLFKSGMANVCPITGRMNYGISLTGNKII